MPAPTATVEHGQGEFHEGNYTKFITSKQHCQ
jgi:hypothetical protein